MGLPGLAFSLYWIKFIPSCFWGANFDKIRLRIYPSDWTGNTAQGINRIAKGTQKLHSNFVPFVFSGTC
jgi:hypothetical protein